MERFLSIIRGWLMYAIGAIAAYGHELTGIILLFLFFFALDFFTGFFASLRQGLGFRSSKARWSFAKSLCYFGTFATIAFMGLALN
ncbi:MAG: phage holin family protein, partial [Tannerella sp.]|nr:phage holin family protein [Tannerella sp.]